MLCWEDLLIGSGGVDGLWRKVMSELFIEVEKCDKGLFIKATE